MDVSGKRAVVLGGTSGIGLAVVQRLLDAGAEVVAGGRSEGNLAAAASAAPSASFRTIDVLDRDGLEAMFSEIAPFENFEFIQGNFFIIDFNDLCLELLLPHSSQHHLAHLELAGVLECGQGNFLNGVGSCDQPLSIFFDMDQRVFVQH